MVDGACSGDALKEASSSAPQRPPGEPGAERGAPVLPPSGSSAGRAAAVAAPALDAVRAAPGGTVEDFRLVSGRKQLQRLRQVHQLDVAALGELADRRRDYLVAALAVVAERLAVDGDREHLVVLATFGEAGLDPGHEILAAAQRLAERHRARDGPIVEEHGKMPPGAERNEVRPRWIEPRAGGVQPLAARGPHPPALVRRQHGEPDALFVERLQRAQVGSGLRQPHAFRLASKPVPEVADAPADLRAQVPLV